jgi:hypothetical protein
MTSLDSTSLHRFLLHSIDGLTSELAEQFLTLPADAKFQQRLDELGDLASEGALSKDERREYDTYIEAMDVIALLRVKVLSRAK